MKAVFVGNDLSVAEFARLGLRLLWPDWQLMMAATATRGLELVAEASPDLLLLHPDFSDMTLAKSMEELRRFSDIFLIVLGHQAHKTEGVTALRLGADDYVRLPCDLTELMVRIWALFRRAGMRPTDQTGGPLSCGPLLINPATYEVFLNSRRITLTFTEFRLLDLLARHWGTTVPRQMLEQNLCGDEVDCYGLVKKYVQRLRRKLGDNAREPRWIASIRGVGYRFIGPPPRKFFGAYARSSTLGSGRVPDGGPELRCPEIPSGNGLFSHRPRGSDL